MNAFSGSIRNAGRLDYRQSPNIGFTPLLGSQSTLPIYPPQISGPGRNMHQGLMLKVGGYLATHAPLGGTDIIESMTPVPSFLDSTRETTQRTAKSIDN